MPLLFQDPSLDRTERGLLYTSYVLRGLIAVELVAAVVQHLWPTAVFTAGILVLTFLPMLIRSRFRRIYLPVEFDLLAVLFIFASLFLGNVRSFYERFWWWDVALHSGSGLLTALLGFVLVYLLNASEHTRLEMSSLFVALFAFTFAMTIGALWEILEFAIDTSFATRMQRASLVDTMWDLIVNTGGALIVSASGYSFLRMGHPLPLERLVRRMNARRRARAHRKSAGHSE